MPRKHKTSKDRTRNIGGVVFKESQGNLTKKKAQGIAATWKMKGRKSRVLPGKWPIQHTWSVFIEQK